MFLWHVLLLGLWALATVHSQRVHFHPLTQSQPTWPSEQHHCIHDSLDHSHLSLQEQPVLNQGVGLDQVPIGSTQPLRIKVVSLIGTDTDRECTRNGQRVKVGNINSIRRGDVCGEKNTRGQTITDDCIFICTDDDVLSADKSTFLTTVLEDSAQFFLDTLRVQRQSPLPVTSSQCGGHPLQYASSPNPSSVTDADYILYVTARPTIGATLAFAVTCEFDSQTTGRPIVGWANFGPARILPGDPGVESVARHEISHALGFSASSWPRFRDRQTGATRPADEVTSTSTRAQGKGNKEVLMMTTDKVVQEVRKHFGCDTLTGAELENNGGSGTASSHWEKRLFGNDFMIGSKGSSAVYSPMTFAAFHDSGWYDVDFTSSHIGTNPWGARQGCSFTSSSCGDAAWQSLGLPYYCTEGQKQCTFDQTSWGSCALAQYTQPLPPEYQYFDDPSVGGLSELDDYCPVIVSVTGRDCRQAPVGALVTGGNGDDLSARYMNARGSSWGVHPGGAIGHCFETTLNRDTGFFDSNALPRTGCYMQACVGPSAAKVLVGKRWYDCPTGKVLTDQDFFESFGGQLACNDAEVMCGDSPVNTRWPVFTGVVPTEANAAGGDTLTISGSNLQDVSEVYISDLPCPIDSATATQVVCTTQGGRSSGVGDVYLITNQAISTSSPKGVIAIARDCNFACRAEEWMKGNTDEWWGYAPGSMLNWHFVIFAVILFAMLVTCCCHCRRRRKEKKKRQEAKLRRQQQYKPQQGYREMRDVQL